MEGKGRIRSGGEREKDGRVRIRLSRGSNGSEREGEERKRSLG